MPMVCVGTICSVIHSTLGLAGRATSHEHYANLYAGIASHVDYSLARDPDWRTPADAFFAEVRTRMGNINASAPQLPGAGCCGCTKYESDKIPLPPPTVSGGTQYGTTSGNPV
jgi:hypothetical protein